MLVPPNPSGGVGGPPVGGPPPQLAALLQSIAGNNDMGNAVPESPLGGMDMRKIALLLAALRAAQNGGMGVPGGGPGGPGGPMGGPGGMPGGPMGMGGPPPIVPPQAL